MFKVVCQITKAKRGENGEFRIRGVASDTSIDRDTEKFAESAIVDMHNDINGGGVVLRAEHQPGFYQEIGKVVSATINKKGQLVIEAIVDHNMSIGKDFIYICEQALLGNRALPGFSIGGYVLDADWEYSAEMKKDILVFKRINLVEVSLVSTPSNMNVSLELPIGKSVRVDKETHAIMETEEAKAVKELFNKKQKSHMVIDFKKGVLVDQMNLQDEIREAKWSAEEFWNIEGYYDVLLRMICNTEMSEEKKDAAIGEFVAMLRAYAELHNMTIDELQDLNLGLKSFTEESEMPEIVKSIVTKDTSFKKEDSSDDLDEKEGEEVKADEVEPAKQDVTLEPIKEEVKQKSGKEGISQDATYVPKEKLVGEYAMLGTYVRPGHAGLYIGLTPEGVLDVTSVEVAPIIKTQNEEEEIAAEEELAKEEKVEPTVEEIYAEAEESAELRKSKIQARNLSSFIKSLIGMDVKSTLEEKKTNMEYASRLLSSTEKLSGDEEAQKDVMKTYFDIARTRITDYIDCLSKEYGLGVRSDLGTVDFDVFVKTVDNYVEAGKIADLDEGSTAEVNKTSGDSYKSAEAEEFQKQAQALKFSKLVEEKVEAVKKQVAEKLELQNAQLKAAVEIQKSQTEKIEKLEKLVDSIASKSVARKSIATFMAGVESDYDSSPDKEYDKVIKETGATNFQAAYAAKKRAELQNLL